MSVQASTPAAAHLLNALASASRELKRSAARVAVEATEVGVAQGIVPINQQTYADMLATVSQVNTLIEVAHAVATDEQILLARTDERVYFSA